MFLLYFVFAVIIMLIVCREIYKTQIDEKNRLHLELMKLEKSFDSVIFLALIQVILTIVLLILLFDLFNKTYQALKGDYISNFFQLFNINYMISLKEYFLENNMISHFIIVLNYIDNLPSRIYWVIFSGSFVVINFYKGLSKNIIYKDGIRINSNLIKWDEIVEFKWSDPYEKRIFNKGRYYKLIITLPKFYDLQMKAKLIIPFDEKENVNNIISQYVIKDKEKHEIQLNFTPFHVMITEKLALKKIKLEDKNELFLLKSNDEVLKYLDNEKHKSIEDTEKYIMKINDAISRNESILWGITLKDSTSLIGTICIWNISKEQRTAEIGYDLMPEYQGKGIMNEALDTVVKYAFKFIKLDNLTAYTNKENKKSVKLLERNGFKFDGEEDNNLIFKLENFEL